MSTLIKAADDARRLLRGFQSLSDVADALEQVGKLEQRQAEAEAALADLGTKIEAAKAELDRVKRKAEEVIEYGESTAAKLAANAQAAADATLTVAKNEATKLIAEARAKVDVAAEHELASLTKAVEALKQRDELLAECVEIEKRAEKARAFIAKLKD